MIFSLKSCRWRGGDSLHGHGMCAIQRVNGQDKRLQCLWTGYGSRCQAHQFECVKNWNAAGFFTLNSWNKLSGMMGELMTAGKEMMYNFAITNCEWRTAVQAVSNLQNLKMTQMVGKNWLFFWASAYTSEAYWAKRQTGLPPNEPVRQERQEWGRDSTVWIEQAGENVMADYQHKMYGIPFFGETMSRDRFREIVRSERMQFPEMQGLRVLLHSGARVVLPS
jgi:hypothetical protein